MNKSLPQPGSVASWWLAIRPKTLFAAFLPVWLGTALAYRHDHFDFLPAVAALLGAFLIQIGTNLANDYWDARKGADTSERLGPIRVVAAGLLPARVVFSAMVLSFALAATVGLYLVLHAGWSILLLGVGSILLGILYTAGPASLAYLGLGDLATFLFFGLFATAGTYFVQALIWLPEAFLLGVVPGLYSVALIALNNLRDRPQDVLVGKRTLAVRLGDPMTRWEISLCLLLPPTCGPFFFDLEPSLLLFAIGVFVALPVLLPLWRGASGRELNPLLGKTAAAGLLFSLLLGLHLIRL
jgi:1,4-dihydroxy-2-naphthoate octaprenyltransferase